MTALSDLIATPTLNADTPALERAVRLLQAGELVAFPTETVYGLGADARNDAAVAKIFAVKERPRINPLIVHVASLEVAQNLAVFNARARALARAFWPGGLTLALPRRDDSRLSLLVSAGLDTVAIRVPRHPVALALLRASGLAIAAPSANRSGRVSPTEARHVAEELGGRIPLILDGGACPVGVESTVIGFEGEAAMLLRKGAVPREAITELIGPVFAPRAGALTAPGMMESHYAPEAPLRLNATEVRGNEALLAFGTPLTGATRVLNLSPAGALDEAAANLFAMLRRLDADKVSGIAVMPIPQTGLGEAINDRLVRAAAPRERLPS
jgi:L-threonylcarbamoyladenylate synthase